MVSGETLKCSIDSFLNHYAPFIPSPETIANALQALGVLKEIGGSEPEGWFRNDYVRDDLKPNTLKIPGYRLLQDVADWLRNVECHENNNGAKRRSCRFTNEDLLSTTMESDIHGIDLQPDVHTTKNPHILLPDTVVITEFRTGAKTIDKEEVSAHNINCIHDLTNIEEPLEARVDCQQHLERRSLPYLDIWRVSPFDTTNNTFSEPCFRLQLRVPRCLFGIFVAPTR